MGAFPDAIEGVPVLGAFSPASIEEAALWLGEREAIGDAVFPVGGGTSLSYGLPPTRPGFLLSLQNLSAVKSYPSEDMTITVEAGLGVSSLLSLLAAHGQTLPIDCAQPERATVGGLLATDASGPRRYGYGTLRDYLLGVDFLTPKGARVHAGGQVVKNVAGYDLMKLQIGALGTLGVLVQASFKLVPLPEHRGGLLFALSPEAIEEALGLLNDSATRPTAIELVSREAGIFPFEVPFVLMVLFEGSEGALFWQKEALARELSRLSLSPLGEISTGEEYEALLGRLTGWPSPGPVRESHSVAGSFAFCVSGPSAALPSVATRDVPPGTRCEARQGALRASPDPRHPARSGILEQALAEGEVAYKVGLLPGEVGRFCQAARDALPQGALLCSAGSGVVRGVFGAKTEEQAEAHLRALFEVTAKSGGRMILTRCPAAWKGRLPVWGAPRRERFLMQAVKRKLDPGDILNPGRLW